MKGRCRHNVPLHHGVNRSLPPPQKKGRFHHLWPQRCVQCPYSGADIRVKNCRQDTLERPWTHKRFTKQCSCTSGSEGVRAAWFYLLCKCLLDQEILWFDSDCANSNSGLSYMHHVSWFCILKVLVIESFLKIKRCEGTLQIDSKRKFWWKNFQPCSSK